MNLDEYRLAGRRLEELARLEHHARFIQQLLGAGKVPGVEVANQHLPREMAQSISEAALDLLLDRIETVKGELVELGLELPKEEEGSPAA